jgi:hypothetical protein
MLELSIGWWLFANIIVTDTASRPKDWQQEEDQKGQEIGPPSQPCEMKIGTLAVTVPWRWELTFGSG